MNKKKRRVLLKAVLLSAFAAVTLTGMTGCKSQNAVPQDTDQHAAATSPGEQSTVNGTILLAVNPEIFIDFDTNGNVLSMEGRNKEGKEFLKQLKSYEGQECRIAVANLVDAIYEAGYFNNTLGGQTSTIVVKAEAGSSYPSEDFMVKIADAIRNVAAKNHLDAVPILIEEKDLDGNGYISIDKAKELVMAHLGLSDARFKDHEQELDDGRYEFEIIADGVEYDYEVNAVTGRIVKAEREIHD